MLLVADAGSTKTQWKCNGNPIIETVGFNPMFHDTAFVLDEITKSTELSTIRESITSLYFYGAGCSSDGRKKIISDALSSFFPNAKLRVGHDLEAAAYATYVSKPTIACIIGTGSNSCLFDGQTITEVVPSLGYILGDEGSGAYFGKKLLTDFLYKNSPPATQKILSEKYGLTKEIIFENVYRKPNANVYLATFAKVLSESPDTDYVASIVRNGFNHFILQHVCCYPNYQEYAVSFVGSMAFYFQAIIKDLLTQNECELGVIIKSPIELLYAWHENQ